MASGVAGVLLSSCSSDSTTLARQACAEVEASLRLYAAAGYATTPSLAARDQAIALRDLRAALRPAALAASNDGQWQALEATLSETSRVPESELVIALRAQCAVFGPAGRV